MATPSGFAMMIGFPTVVSLFIAGIWHGAGLQFLIFGLLHAGYLTTNHAYRIFRGGQPRPEKSPLATKVTHAGSVLLTFSAVVLAQIFFRALGVRSALQMLAGMFGLHHGLAPMANEDAFTPSLAALLPIAAAFFIVWGMPNTQQILTPFRPAIELAPSDRDLGRWHWFWRPTPLVGFVMGALILAVLVKMENPTTFLYFQF